MTEANDEFKHEVQKVNIAFVEGYTALFEQVGRDGVEGIGPNPVTDFNPVSVSPQIGDGVASPSSSVSPAMSGSARKALSASAPRSAPTRERRS